MARLLELRRRHPLLRHPHWFGASAERGHARLRWLHPAGQEMQIHDWHDTDHHAFSCELAAADGSERLLLLFNPETREQGFVFAPADWTVLLDSSVGLTSEARAASPLIVPAHTLCLLRATANGPTP